MSDLSIAKIGGKSYNLKDKAARSMNACTTCTTAAGTAAKTASQSGYTLVTGGIVSVRFTNAISVASATLNINSQGAKPIYYNGAALAANVVKAGDTVALQYNGSRYHIISIERHIPVITTAEIDELLAD